MSKQAKSGWVVMYKIGYRNEIVSKEFENVTEKSVIWRELDVRGSFRVRRSSIEGWHKTPQEAIEEARARHEGRLFHARERVTTILEYVNRFNSLHPKPEAEAK